MHYVYGKIVWTNKKSVIFESNNKGYKINVVNVDKLTIDKFIKLYVYKLLKLDHKNNIVSDYYGFTNAMEKMLFVDLISINGIGAITAFNILENDVNLLIDAIANGNIDGLKILKNISSKNAILIVNTLKDKYEKMSINNSNKKNKISTELIYALKKLGYKNDDLKYINEIDYSDDEDISDIISKSIKFIATKHEQQNPN